MLRNEPLINSIGSFNRKVTTDLKSNNNKSLRIILHPLIFHFENISEKLALQMRFKEVKEFPPKPHGYQVAEEKFNSI